MLYNLVFEDLYFYKYSYWDKYFFKLELIIVFCIKGDFNYLFLVM